MSTLNIENHTFLKIPIEEIWREDNLEDFEESLGLEYYDEESSYYLYKLKDKNKFIYGIMKHNISFEQTIILDFN